MTGMFSEQWSIKDFALMDHIPAATFLTVYDSGHIRVEGKYFQDLINEIENGNIHLKIKKVFKLEEIVEAFYGIQFRRRQDSCSSLKTKKQYL